MISVQIGILSDICYCVQVRMKGCFPVRQKNAFRWIIRIALIMQAISTARLDGPTQEEKTARQISLLNPAKIFSACGGAVLYRREVFDQIGLFDEAHFAYLEDVDVGYRAQICGYENWYEPQAVVYHKGSAATGSRHNTFKVSHASRNNIYLIYKNMARWQILINHVHFCLPDV